MKLTLIQAWAIQSVMVAGSLELAMTQGVRRPLREATTDSFKADLQPPLQITGVDHLMTVDFRPKSNGPKTQSLIKASSPHLPHTDQRRADHCGPGPVDRTSPIGGLNPRGLSSGTADIKGEALIKDNVDTDIQGVSGPNSKVATKEGKEEEQGVEGEEGSWSFCSEKCSTLERSERCKGVHVCLCYLARQVCC